MDQINFDGQTLILKVKPSPIFTRVLLFGIGSITAIIPVIGSILFISSTGGFHIGFVFGMLLFGLLGFYIFRAGLWNSFGLEVIKLDKNRFTYWADYNWFKDAKKTHKWQEIDFVADSTQYEEDNQGVLVILCDEREVRTVTKLPLPDLYTLIDKLRQEFSEAQKSD